MNFNALEDRQRLINELLKYHPYTIDPEAAKPFLLLKDGHKILLDSKPKTRIEYLQCRL